MIERGSSEWWASKRVSRVMRNYYTLMIEVGVRAFLDLTRQDFERRTERMNLRKSKIPDFKPKPMNWQFYVDEFGELCCCYCHRPLYVREESALRSPETSIELRAATSEHSLVCEYWKKPPRPRNLSLVAK